MNLDNISGAKFGSWVVIKCVDLIKDLLLCRCVCGTERSVSFAHLRYGRSKSCGCSREKVNGLLPGEAGFNQLFLSYKKSAKKRNLEFTLSKDEFRKLVTQDCYYCGEPPSNFIRNQSKYSTFIYNGIDRANNLIGYILGNCLPSCTGCNSMKRSLGSDEFVKHCIKISRHQRVNYGL